MFGIGAGELMLLLVLALLVLGPERMPGLARDLGKTVGDLRRTSDELKQEFLNADAVIDRAAKLGEPDPPTAAALVEPASPPSEEAGATQADLASPEPDPEAAASPEPEPVPKPDPEPDETAFDREARLARERLDDPARAARAKAEGWTVPTDEAGADSDKWS